MNDRLLIGTRKGMFEFRRADGSWTITAAHFLGDPVSMLLADDRDGTLYAAQALGHFGVKLQRSDDAGAHWQQVTAPAFTARESDSASVSYLFCLETAGRDRPGEIWCGTIPGALFLSRDRGESWTINDALWRLPERERWAGGGFDDSGVASICVDPRHSSHIAVGVSTGGVWLTKDDGASWHAASDGLYAEYMPPQMAHDPASQDVHRLVQCAAGPDTYWVQHHNGVFRSTDGSRTWQEIETIRPAKFGFAVAVHPHDPNTAWFVPGVKDECRIPVDARLVVARTRDGGQTFDVLSAGLPQSNAYDLVYRHALAVDASGSRLAMGSTTGHLWLTEDGGDHWALIGGHLPPINCVRFVGSA